MGSDAMNCWKHVVRCCEYVGEFEHWLFLQHKVLQESSKNSGSKGRKKSKLPIAKSPMDDGDDPFSLE